MSGKNAKVSPWSMRAARGMALLLVIGGAAIVNWQPAFARPALPSPPDAYGDAVKQISAQLADVIAGAGKKTVAVNDFADLDGNVTELGRFLAGDVSDSLAAQAKGFLVIDRTRSQSAAAPAAVDAVITATLTAFSDHVRLSAKVIDAGNSAILGTAAVDIPRTKDIDDLLARSPSARAPASSTSPSLSSAPSSQTAQGPIPAAAGTAPSGKSSKGSSKPPKAPAKPPAPAVPTDSGTGSVTTDAYRVVAMSLAHSAGTVTVNLEFDSVSDSTVQLAMVRAESYLTDETGVRWTLNQLDTAGIFNVRAMAGGGFWRGVPLARGAKIQTTLTFTPQGPAAGTKFTLTMSEFRPKWNRTVAIQGLK
jgi:hypothetical protein